MPLLFAGFASDSNKSQMKKNVHMKNKYNTTGDGCCNANETHYSVLYDIELSENSFIVISGGRLNIYPLWRQW